MKILKYILLWLILDHDDWLSILSTLQPRETLLLCLRNIIQLTSACVPVGLLKSEIKARCWKYLTDRECSTSVETNSGLTEVRETFWKEWVFRTLSQSKEKVTSEEVQLNFRPLPKHLNIILWNQELSSPEGVSISPESGITWRSQKTGTLVLPFLQGRWSDFL